MLLSTLLFNVLIADLEEVMGRVKLVGVTLMEEKVSCADDMVLLAEEDEEMSSMVGRLKEYLEGKSLELNTDKTKVMRFRRGRGIMERRIWRLRGKVIEEVRSINVLDTHYKEMEGRKQM